MDGRTIKHKNYLLCTSCTLKSVDFEYEARKLTSYRVLCTLHRTWEAHDSPIHVKHTTSTQTTQKHYKIKKNKIHNSLLPLSIKTRNEYTRYGNKNGIKLKAGTSISSPGFPYFSKNPLSSILHSPPLNQTFSFY